MVQIAQICNWSNGSWLSFYQDGKIKELVIDTRKVSEPEYALFIALASPRRDGHDFITAAYEKGIRNFLVQQEVNVDRFPSANFILVKDTLQALQQFTSAYRKQFNIPVIGIT
ncbi:MAG TPA: Mur ligase domain-containing protein, partial [Flavipsychrobacter sp.]|nr:Mur ligase domain-containing protein [Flavipsychrobacter sp.]